MPTCSSAATRPCCTAWRCVTRYGELDLTFSPSGTGGYPDLVRSAVELRVGDVAVRVAALH